MKNIWSPHVTYIDVLSNKTRQYRRLLFIFLLTSVSVGARAQIKMAGTYTIGSGSGFDYANVSAAAADVVFNGVKAPVVFLIENGTYVGRVDMSTYIEGSSPKNTITFKGKSGNASKVVLSNFVSTVIYLSKSRHLIFRDLSVINTSTRTTGQTALYLRSDSCKFFNCTFQIAPTTQYNYTCDGSYGRENLYDGCTFKGGGLRNILTRV